MLLRILRHPDPCLARPALPVKRVDAALRQLARDMAETMRHAKGIGLAAPQVGVSLRLAVVDLDPEAHRPVTLVNPVITRLSRQKTEAEEGCLSFPGLTAPLRRAARAWVSALDLEGQTVEWSAEGLLARAFQHELDHLDGTVFLDRLSPTARREADRKLESP